MNIKTHFDLLIDTYNLHHLYKKYIFISILFTVVRESFQWCLLGFSLIVKKHSHLIYKFIYILLFIYLLLIPLEKYFNNITNEKDFFIVIINHEQLISRMRIIYLASFFFCILHFYYLVVVLVVGINVSK